MNSAKYFADVQRQRAAEAAMLAKLEKDRQHEATVGYSFKDILQKLVCRGLQHARPYDCLVVVSFFCC
jgi:hypothetical protein